MAYKVGPDLRLFRANIPLSLQGGFLMLSEGEADSYDPTSASPDTLASEVIRECIHRGFQGVVLTFTQNCPALHEFTKILAKRLHAQGAALFLPEHYAIHSDFAKILVPTAISGGSLTARLSELISHYGAKRLCLDIERVRMDFCLPSERGEGRKLSADALYELTQTMAPHTYFSQDLCAYYFTYQNTDGSHFVLYDDSGSIRKKLFLAEKLGIEHALLLYPEVEEILHQVTHNRY